MSTEQAWMSADQFARVLEAYAELRTEYLTPDARKPGAYNSPTTSRSEQDLILEIASFRSAAHILRNLDEPPPNLPSWRWDDWPALVDAIKHDPPVGVEGGQQ